MDGFDLFAAVIFVVICAVASLRSNKKKNRTQTPRPKNAARPKGTPPKPPVGRQEAAKPKSRTMMPAREGEDPCHEDMLTKRPSQMHYQEVETAEMESAGEGTDPCHVGSAETASAYDVHDGGTDADGEGRAKTAKPEKLPPIVQGIVMAEVLKRPALRREERRMHRHRKAAYGRENSGMYRG